MTAFYAAVHNAFPAVLQPRLHCTLSARITPEKCEAYRKTRSTTCGNCLVVGEPGGVSRKPAEPAPARVCRTCGREKGPKARMRDGECGRCLRGRMRG